MKALGIVMILVSLMLFVVVAIYWHKINKE